MRQTNQLNQIIKKFSPKQAKRALSYKFYIYQFSLSDMKIDISHGDDLQVFYLSKTDGPQTDRSWTIQTYSDEINRARRRTFHEVNSLSLVRFLKSSTCVLPRPKST